MFSYAELLDFFQSLKIITSKTRGYVNCFQKYNDKWPTKYNTLFVLGGSIFLNVIFKFRSHGIDMVSYKVGFGNFHFYVPVSNFRNFRNFRNFWIFWNFDFLFLDLLLDTNFSFTGLNKKLSSFLLEGNFGNFRIFRNFKMFHSKLHFKANQIEREFQEFQEF